MEAYEINDDDPEVEYLHFTFLKGKLDVELLQQFLHANIICLIAYFKDDSEILIHTSFQEMKLEEDRVICTFKVISLVKVTAA